MSGRPIYILKSTFNIELSEFLLSTFIHNLRMISLAANKKNISVQSINDSLIVCRVTSA
jgi:hypothetical protein